MKLPEARRLKMYWYPQIPRYSVDDVDLKMQTYGMHYGPFDQEGRERWLEFVDDPKQAEIFFAGQISPRADTPWSLFPYGGDWQGRPRPRNVAGTAFQHLHYLVEYYDRHIWNIVGDFQWECVPTPLQACIIATVGGSDYFPNCNMFVTPLSSSLLKHLVSNLQKDDELTFPATKSFAFRGEYKPGLREIMGEAFKASGLPGVYDVSGGWGMWLPVNDARSVGFQELCQQHLLQLCPAGVGPCSPRNYEACYYGRVPVLFSGALGSNTRLLGWDFYDTSFAFSIPASCNVAEVAAALYRIYATPLEELQARGMAAKHYFDEVVRPYFADPTEMFVRYLILKLGL